LFAALSQKRLDRTKLSTLTRLVLNEARVAQSEMEKEFVKAQAEARVALAEKNEAALEARLTEALLKDKNLEVLRLANSVTLRAAVGKYGGVSGDCIHVR
jgi:hypothetical protein